MLRVVVGLVIGVLLVGACPARAERARTPQPIPPRPAASLDTTRQSPPPVAPGLGPAETPGDGERRRDPGPRPAPPRTEPVAPYRTTWGSIGMLDRHVRTSLERATAARRATARPPATSPGGGGGRTGGGAVPGGSRAPANEAADAIPRRLWFGPAFPNPSTGGISFRVDLPRDASVRIRILDVAGRQVDEFGGPRVAGRHTLTWDGRSRAPRSGVYFASLTVDGRAVGERRLVVLR